ncbi:hypothetical protein BCD64_00890 [Nostoc sp. MBR 210]|nr:hypothetical protein BCD64_00890 [Nostoc sp. MBR 210]
MLNLHLRDEFQGSQMPGTVINLCLSNNKGAAQEAPDRILEITYPTADVQAALCALSINREKRPIVLMGDRGRGKSHIMAVMHHAIEHTEQVEAWARSWGTELNISNLREISLQRGFVAITEPVHNHEYPLLWDLLFARHPQGQFFKGKFQQMEQPFPPRSLLEEMFESQPVALILDEFQKWFDGLHDDPGATGRKWRESASNFIQNLSEIAKDRPDILLLVVSVLNNNTDAFQQIHRNGPILIDFRGPTAKQDRKRLLLHRLFKNRQNIPSFEIESLVNAYAKERFRLRFSHLSEAESGRITDDVVESWPFSPELLELLEDQILMAPAAQESRDLIRILAQVFRMRGELTPVITPADFFVNDDAYGVQSLLDSIATSGEQEKLRQIAQRNLEVVRSVEIAIAHDCELISALWMRSMSPGNIRGGSRQDLHLDITRAEVIDDNAFQAELLLLTENSVNIHGEESANGRLYFDLDENPRSKVRATARNPKLWDRNAPANVAGQLTYPGKDVEHIRITVKHALTPETSQTPTKVLVLGPRWKDDPWCDIPESDHPHRWDCPVLIVIPTNLKVQHNKIPDLGEWLASNVGVRRNTVRFLLPGSDDSELYTNPDLLMLARCSYLTSTAWNSDSKYRALKEEFDKPLRDRLKTRFERFAILRHWNFQQPRDCVFEVERHGASGIEIPTTVETKIRSDLFDQAEFQQFVLGCAKESRVVGDILQQLVEPPAKPSVEAIPYLGDTVIYEEILKVAATGKLFLNLNGTWIGRLPEHTDNAQALLYLQQKAFRIGNDLRQVQLGHSDEVGGSTVTGSSLTHLTSPSQPNGSYQVEVTSTRDGITMPPTPLQPIDRNQVLTLDGEKARLTPVSPPLVGEGNGSIPPVAIPLPPRRKSQRTHEQSTGINLSGQFEKWGLAAATPLSTAKLEFTDMTVQQLKQVLQKLPPVLKAHLEVSYLEDEQS